MSNRVLIIGNHPISADLKKQYCQRGDEVVTLKSDQDLGLSDITAYREFLLLSNCDDKPFDADNKVMEILKKIATGVSFTTNGKRPLCHLLLRSQSLLHMIRLDGFREEIEEKLEVNPFTIEDQWSQKIAMCLDREPITKQSEKTVHLVIFGMSDISEQVAMNTAHVCHFPNYLHKDHSLRTRITVIDESAFEKSQEWLQRYRHLFENSYYRFIDSKKRPAVTQISHPMYNDREDFVDIEWEFVKASPYDNLVRDKLVKWSTISTQLLTIVFANDDTEIGLNDALHLPDAVISAQIPVYVYMQNDKAFEQIRHTNNTPHVIPFGMADHGYDISIPIVKMAKNVNYIYDCCYEENDKDWSGRLRFAVEIDEEKKERSWTKKSGVKRMSNIYNAMTIGIKMRSMGFKEDDWDKFYDMSEEDMEILAEVEHNRWSVEELILGWRPCTDAEQCEVETDIMMKEKLKEHKIHYDLRAYHDLRPDGTGRPVQVYDRCLSACIPLIAKESMKGDYD